MLFEFPEMLNLIVHSQALIHNCWSHGNCILPLWKRCYAKFSIVYSVAQSDFRLTNSVWQENSHWCQISKKAKKTIPDKCSGACSADNGIAFILNRWKCINYFKGFWNRIWIVSEAHHKIQGKHVHVSCLKNQNSVLPENLRNLSFW